MNKMHIQILWARVCVKGTRQFTAQRSGTFPQVRVYIENLYSPQNGRVEK